MKEKAHALALKFFRMYGNLLVSEDSAPTQLYHVNFSLWEEIDRIAENTGTNRTEVRAEVISHYSLLAERDEIPKVA